MSSSLRIPCVILVSCVALYVEGFLFKASRQILVLSVGDMPILSPRLNCVLPHETVMIAVGGDNHVHTYILPYLGSFLELRSKLKHT